MAVNLSRILVGLLTGAMVSCAAPAPDDGRTSVTPQLLVLVPCESPLPGAPLAAASFDASPSQTEPARLCGQLRFEDLAERTLQVGVVAERGDRPFEDRTVLIYHPGGPGMSPVDRLLADPPAVDLSLFTLVSWDGATASSTPGSCGSDESRFATDRSRERLARLVLAAAQDCFRGFGADSSFGAATAAAELDVVRAAIDVDRVDLLTHSYGTAIAEAYLNAYPTRVRRAVLDGPLALEVPWLSRLQAVDGALEEVSTRLFASCGVGGCGEGLADLVMRGGYQAIRAEFTDDPPLVGTSSVPMTATMLDQATLLALRGEDSWVPYLGALEAALDGEARDLWTMGEQYVFGVDRVVFYGSLCVDLELPRSVEGFQIRGGPLLETYATELALCSDLGLAAQPTESTASEWESDVLVVASRFDPLTPAALLDHAPILSDRSSVCTTDVLGHTSFGDADVGDLVREFLRTGDGAAIAGRCQP